MDLLGGLELGNTQPSATMITPQATQPAMGLSTPANQMDLLSDLFGGGSTNTPLSTMGSTISPSLGFMQPQQQQPILSAATATSKPAADPLADLFSSAASPSLVAAASAKSYPAYEKNGLRVVLTPVREENGAAMTVTAKFDSTLSTVNALSFQVAVPKVRLCSCFLFVFILSCLKFCIVRA
jgi:AP-1 complex subunit gamma-1